MTEIFQAGHYLSLTGIAQMLAAAAAAIAVSIGILYGFSRSRWKGSLKEARRPEDSWEYHMVSLVERFYELIFSSTFILLFAGVYFTIDYFGVGGAAREFWDKYNGIILLVFILTSVILTSVLDNRIIPLNIMKPGERESMRLIGMLYMLIIFAYIKFIYEDDNYDAVIMYFLTLVIGRFVYFDASLLSFRTAVTEAAENLPLLILALLCTGVLALCGFRSGYLLTANGVVMNLFFAQLFLLVVIFLLHRFGPFQSMERRYLQAKRWRAEEERRSEI